MLGQECLQAFRWGGKPCTHATCWKGFIALLLPLGPTLDSLSKDRSGSREQEVGMKEGSLTRGSIESGTFCTG